MVSAARNIYDSQGQASQGKRVKAQRNTRELDVLPIARPFHMQAEPLARIKQSRLLFFKPHGYDTVSQHSNLGILRLSFFRA